MGKRIALLAKTSRSVASVFQRREPTSADISKAIVDRAPPGVRNLLESLGIDLGRVIEKEARSIVPEAVTTYGFLQETPYDPFVLQTVSDKHWVVRTCRDKLVRESIRKGFRWEPSYEYRCEECEAEYAYLPISEKCPECEGELEKPDREQLVRCNAFLEHPNPQFSMLDVLKRNATDLLTFDDFYVTAITSGTTLEVWPEDARYMRIYADAKGRLGGDSFCPTEEDTKKPGTETKLFPKDEYPAGSTCPNNDGGTLQSLAYGQLYGNAVMAAFAAKEVLHDNLFGTGTRLYGTPKLWALQTQITAMALIDTYQKDSFEKAKTPKNIFIYKGVDDQAVNRFLKQYEEAKKFNTMADMHIPIPMPLAGSKEGSVGIEVVRGIDTPLIQGSIQFQEFYFKAICYTLGVDPASIGVETSGKLGSSGEESVSRGVSQEAIQEIQVQLGEAWDRFLKSKFTEIKDWKFTLETAYEEEESKLWETKLIQMQAAKTAVDAGLDIIIGEDGSVKITGENTQKMRDEKQQEMLDEQAAMNPFGGDSSEDEEEKPSDIEKTEFRHLHSEKEKSVTQDPIGESDIEKVSRWQRELRAVDKQYKERLDAVAKFVFDRLLVELDDILGPGPVEPMTQEIGDAVVSRSNKVLRMAANDAIPMLENAAIGLYRMGMSMGLADINKQDVTVAFDAEDTAAVKAFYERTQDTMKNVLYFGDKQTYLSKIKEITQVCIDSGGCTTRILARRLAEALDPEREHFSDYMWERIARTDTAAYVITGRIKAYEEFDIPKLRRIVTVDERTDPIRCLPFANEVYLVKDGYGVIPAHANCRCAFAPYYGPEESLPESEILRNH